MIIHLHDVKNGRYAEVSMKAPPQIGSIVVINMSSKYDGAYNVDSVIHRIGVDGESYKCLISKIKDKDVFTLRNY